MLAYLQSLERKQLIKKLVNIEEFSWDNYELTDNADIVFEECVNFILEDSPLVIEPAVPKDKVTKLVEDFIVLFPEGTRNAGGEYLRANAKDVASKMSTFINKYKYDASTILGATARYVKQQAREQYKWCSAAHYFIGKNGQSKLATECEAYRSIPEDSGDWQTNLM
jgi:hypothetical protein